ncbi:MAG: hypothetical protein ACI4SP_02660, partial [Eubacteriales bacterium]
VVLMVLPLSVLPAGAATASMTVEEFDRSSVEQDLSGTTIGGVKFSTAKYGYNPLGELQILTFLEFGYGADPALYLYLYNPKDLAISDRDLRHAITLSLNGSDFAKYAIKLLSASGTDEHSRLYLKFKVDIPAEKINAAFIDQESRSYKIGEIELAVNGEVKAYGIGGEWVYTGTTAAGNLTYESKAISVIELKLNPLVYRGEQFTTNFQYDQINSVYFRLPKDFEEKNGKVTSIKCTWTEYDSGWILACKTDNVYSELLKAVGVEIAKYNDAYPQIYLYLGPSAGDRFVFAWNVKDIGDSKVTYNPKVLQWIAKYSGDSDGTGVIVDSNLEDQLNAAWKSYNEGATNYFSQGGTNKTVDIMSDDLFTVTVDSDASFWDRVFNKKIEQSQKAFQRVTTEALLNPEANLLVDASYKDKLSFALTEAEANNEELMVLHFATCAYNAIPVSAKGISTSGDALYACRENIYMGFDIIQFTCEKDGEKVIVPVVASPINVIGDLQFFGKIKDIPSWVITLIAIALVIIVLLVVSIFFPVLIPILKALVWVLVLPFRLLWWLLKLIGKGISKLFHKRE